MVPILKETALSLKAVIPLLGKAVYTLLVKVLASWGCDSNQCLTVSSTSSSPKRTYDLLGVFLEGQTNESRMGIGMGYRVDVSTLPNQICQ